jgi:hypothetical protein
MRELTLEEMRMVTGGSYGPPVEKPPHWQDGRPQPTTRMFEDLDYGLGAKADKKGNAAKAIGNFFGDLLGAAGSIGCAVYAKGWGNQATCAVFVQNAAEDSKPYATAVANAVLRGGGQPGDYACAKIGICR